MLKIKNLNLLKSELLKKGAAAKNYINDNVLVPENIQYDSLTLASENKSKNVMWSCPNVSKLNENWVIALNDLNHNKIHILHIQAETYNQRVFKHRKENLNLLNFEIAIEHGRYIETKSGIDLTDYVELVINY